MNAEEESADDYAVRHHADGTHPGRQAPGRPRLTVAVLTYRRNAYLAELLPLLLAQAGQIGQEACARVLVVDNDPRAGAAAVVAEAAEAAEEAAAEAAADARRSRRREASHRNFRRCSTAL